MLLEIDPIYCAFAALLIYVIGLSIGLWADRSERRELRQELAATKALVPVSIDAVIDPVELEPRPYDWHRDGL